MDTAKTLIAMVGLVAIGFIGGYFTHAQLTKNHLRQVVKEATIPGFEERLFHIIKADEAQRERLSPIIQEYAERLHGIRFQIQHQRKDILDSLHAELENELSEKQLKKLERFIHRQLRFRPPHEKKLHEREKMRH